MTSFSLLHVTDLHIAIPPEDNSLGQRTIWRSREYLYPSCANRYALEAIAEFIWHRRAQFDLVLLTGDLADDGQQRNLSAALRFVASAPDQRWFTSQLSPTLDAARPGAAPFFVIPGNHDRFKGTRRLPGGSTFDQIFEDYWPVGFGGIHSTILQKDEAKLAVIAADFCLKKALNAPVYLGQGRAYAHVVKALLKKTAGVRVENPNVGVVWVSHFPPLLEVDISLRLLYPERLLNAARKANVSHIIAGHLHRNQVNVYSNVEVICTGSASSTGAGELHGNWMYGLDVEVSAQGRISVSKQPFQYHPAEAAFI
jgi:DNA repair exonuclease SbcCD nuclease subunit